MLVWDERWTSERDRLKELSPPALLRFAVACVDRSAWRLWKDFMHSSAAIDLPKASDTLDLLWSMPTTPNRTTKDELKIKAHLDMIEAMIPGDRDHNIKVIGWADLLNAVVFALLCAKNENAPDNAFGAAAYSYQAVFEKEVTSQLDREMLEEEVATIERANIVCMDDLDYQIGLLSNHDSSILIKRHDL